MPKPQDLRMCLLRRGRSAWLLVLAVMAIACVNQTPPTPPNTIATPRLSGRLAEITIRGRVLLPAGLVSEAGGALISNNSGGLIANGASLISNNAAGLISNNGSSYRLARPTRRLLAAFEQLPVEGMTVVLADASGAPFRSLPAVQTDAAGNFSIPNVPKGLTYTVQAKLPTPKGDIRVATLAASSAAVTVSVASTIALEALKPKAGALWGTVDETKLARAADTLTKGLGVADVRLAFVNTLTEQNGQVLERLQTQAPELKADLVALASQVAEVPKEAEALAVTLRSQPDAVASLRPDAEPSPGVSLAPGPTPSPTLAPVPSPTPSPTPSIAPISPASVQVTTLAGSTPGSADGTGAAAQFKYPFGVAVDAAGNVYVGDHSNHRIRKVSPTGVVTTLAGSGGAGNADGTGTAARFNLPVGLAVDAAGNVYVADHGYERIRKVSPTGVVTTLAGSTPGYADGTGAAAQFDNLFGVAVDAAGNVYVADHGNNRIRKVSPTGVVTTLAGSTLGYADGTGAAAKFEGPHGVAVDAAGNVYVADRDNNRIRKVSPTGVVTTLAGSTQGYADGTGAAAQFSSPTGVAVDAAGNVYVADRKNDRIRKVSPTGVVTTLAGSTQGYADDTGASAKFANPTGVAVDSIGNIYVADRENHRIRKIQQP